MEITLNAEDILRFLVKYIKTRAIIAGDPRTYVGYKEVHDYLHLPMMGDTYGTSLSLQGLANLAEWARDNRLPAITGLVIDKSTFMPGDGYWRVNNRDEDFKWWKEQIEESLIFDWDKLLTPGLDDNNESSLIKDVPKTPRPADFEEPSEPTRILSETYRILRDTELVRKIKNEHQFKCQICGMSIALSNNLNYVEGHHIKPLGEPHNGPDIEQNIICVCPNHHVQLDYGAIRLDRNTLEQTPNHSVGDEYILYHNNNIWRKEYIV